MRGVANKPVQLTAYPYNNGCARTPQVPIGDEVLLPQISNVVHSLAPSLQFVWVPYYRWASTDLNTIPSV